MSKFVNSYKELYSIFAFTTLIASAQEKYELVAVSNAKIASALFRRIRSESPHVQEPPDLDSTFRERICRSIFNSNYFQYAKEEYVFEDMNELYNHLKEREPSLLAPMFNETSPDSSKPAKLGILRSFLGTRMLRRISSAVGLSSHEVLYTNPTKPVDVYASEEAQETTSEYMFTCLNIVYKGDDETSYFAYISAGEYNLSDTSDDSYIAGRFVFSYQSLKNNEIDVFAVAEEPPEQVPNASSDVERSYTRNLAEHFAGFLDNRICRLSRMERLRVCTLVLSAEYFGLRPKFVPTYEFVDRSRCVKRKISFQKRQMREEFKGVHYEEWMIGCRLELDSEASFSYPSEYFLSRVYNSRNQVFVFSPLDDTSVVLENMFHKVRFTI